MSSPRVNFSGQRFGMLLALHAESRGKRRFWLCRCDCGREIWIRHDCLARPVAQRSCGCERRAIPPHGRKHHGLYYTAENAIWRSMLRRCLTPSDTNYNKYGARGISVCDRWRLDFLAFLEDMGPRPSASHSIERIDNNGNYEPENCKWIEASLQGRNTRRTHYVVVNGERLSLAGAVEKYGGKYHTIKKRLYLGWSVDRAFGLVARQHQMEADWRHGAKVELARRQTR